MGGYIEPGLPRGDPPRTPPPMCEIGKNGYVTRLSGCGLTRLTTLYGPS